MNPAVTIAIMHKSRCEIEILQQYIPMLEQIYNSCTNSKLKHKIYLRLKDWKSQENNLSLDLQIRIQEFLSQGMLFIQPDLFNLIIQEESVLIEQSNNKFRRFKQRTIDNYRSQNANMQQ